MSKPRRESDTAPHRSILHLRSDSNVLGGMSKLLGILLSHLLALIYPVANRSEIATRIFRTAHELSMYNPFPESVTDNSLQDNGSRILL